MRQQRAVAVRAADCAMDQGYRGVRDYRARQVILSSKMVGLHTNGMYGMLRPEVGLDHGDGVCIKESMQVGVFGDHNQAALGGARDDHMIG